MIKKLKSELLTSIKNKRLNVFLLFLFSAFVILIFTKLSKDYTNTISFNVEKLNVPQDKIILNDSSHKLAITLKTHGFKWLKYYFSKPKVSIDFSNEVYKKNNTFVYAKSVSYLNEKKPFQNEVILLNITPDTLLFKFDTNLVKKVPVSIDAAISFAPGFDVVNNYEVMPDSITVVGPHELVQNIHSVKTQPIVINDVKADITMVTKLEVNKHNGDLIFSSEEVNFTAKVGKFTEGTVTIPIQIVNLPEDISIKYFPKEVKITYYTSLENFNNISPSDFKVKCDYNKLTENQSVLIPEITKSPKGVKNIKLNQKHIEFIILK